MRKFAVLVLITIVVSFPFLACADELGPVGRYQLLYAAHGVGSDAHKSVWKIDTVTGQVWEYIATADPDDKLGTVKGAFVPATESLGPALER